MDDTAPPLSPCETVLSIIARCIFKSHINLRYIALAVLDLLHTSLPSRLALIPRSPVRGFLTKASLDQERLKRPESSEPLILTTHSLARSPLPTT